MKKQSRFTKRVNSIQVSATKQMPILAASMKDTVSLGQGVPAMPIPKYIKDSIKDLLDNNDYINQYSLQPGVPELKQAIAKELEIKIGRPVDAGKEVFITAGSMEALLASVMTVVEKGDEVILFDPGYASHIEQVLLAEGKPVFVSLDKDTQWSLSREKLEAAVSSKTKAIILCNPANPTGKVFSGQELTYIAEVAKKHNLFIITDETYDFLVYGKSRFSSLTTNKDIKDQVIACYSFSKEFIMTGWRVGYLYANADFISQALKVHDAAVICAPTISQYAALAALTGEGRVEAQKNIKTELSKRREVMCERLDNLKDLFLYDRPQGAYYVFAKYLKTELNSWDFSVKMLKETGVITIPGSSFGPSGEGYIRMSFGGTERQINEAFDRIDKWNRSSLH